MCYSSRNWIVNLHIKGLDGEVIDIFKELHRDFVEQYDKEEIINWYAYETITVTNPNFIGE